MTRFSMRAFALPTIAVAFAFASPAYAQEESPSPSPTAAATAMPSPAPSSTPEGWHFRVTPYVWLPTINASFLFSHPTLSSSSGVPVVLPGQTTVGVRITPTSYASHLHSAGELAVEADRAGSMVFADVIYVNLGTESSEVVDLSGPAGHVTLPVNVSTFVQPTSTIATGGIGGVFAHSAGSEFSAFVGVRYINLTASASWTLTGPLGLYPRSGSASDTKSDLQGIIGARGQLTYGRSYFTPLYIDYGGSGDLTTYQWLVGIGRNSPYNAAILGWRQLAYFANNNSRVFVQSLHLGGPLLAYTFKF